MGSGSSSLSSRPPIPNAPKPPHPRPWGDRKR